MVGPDTTATTAPPATTTTTTTILQHLRLCRTRAWARTDSAPTDCGPFTNLWPAAAGPPAHGPGQPLRPLPLPARGLAPADPLLKCLGPYRLGAHGGIHCSFTVADSVGTQRRPRRHRSFTSIPTPAAPLYPLLTYLGPQRLGAHGGGHPFRRSRKCCWDPATASSLPLLYHYPDACRPAVDSQGPTTTPVPSACP